MKKLLQNLMNDQAGSMFIYLFIFSTTLLLLTLVLIHQYQNEHQMGQLELEHMQLDMIHQQTYQSIVTNWDEIHLNEKMLFSFPNGEASVIISDAHQDFYSIVITTSNESSHQLLKKYQVRKDHRELIDE